MSGGLVIVLIIVVWLFVLAPLLLRGQKPIRKAGEAFDETRVIHEGGSGELRSRRRPRVTPADVRPPREETDEDYELVDDDDVLIDDRGDGGQEHGSGRLGGVFASASAKFRRRGGEDDAGDDREQIVEGDLVHELEAAPAEESGTHAAVAAPAERGAADAGESAAVDEEYWDEESWDQDGDGHYVLDDTYISPADLLDPRAAGDDADIPREPGAQRDLTADEQNEPEEMNTDVAPEQGRELTDEELEFAQRRSRRGGWDPEEDEYQSVSRYQRRQRTLIGLGVGVAVTLVAAFLVGGWAWALPVVAGVLTVVYLFALRGQVREEQELRARRVRQLRRARLGVRQGSESERPVPRQLRRPGARVLEIDDESPDFEHLDTVVPEYDQGSGNAETYDLFERRRVS